MFKALTNVSYKKKSDTNKTNSLFPSRAQIVSRYVYFILWSVCQNKWRNFRFKECTWFGL